MRERVGARGEKTNAQAERDLARENCKTLAVMLKGFQAHRGMVRTNQEEINALPMRPQQARHRQDEARTW